MKKNKIELTRPFLPNISEYIAEIKDIWRNKWLTNTGVKHNKFEKELSDYLGVNNIVLFVNGHLALESIIEVFNLSGEIITTPFTFASTTNAIVRKGLKPVFCDIEYDSLTIDPKKIRKLINKNTVAIIPVHVYGNICKIEEIDKIAKEYNLKVIYDAAHAFGVKYKGIGIGNFGDATMFSFHATKVFHSIEGGAIATKYKSIVKKLKLIRNFGITGEETLDYIGGNAKMNEFQAAMGICNLRHINENISKRRLLFERYLSNLDNIKGIILPKQTSEVEQNYSYFPIIFDGYKLNRNQIYTKLRKNSIISRKYFYPIISDFKCYKKTFKINKTPIAKYIADRILTLPLYSDLTLKEVDEICDLIIHIK